MIKTNVRKLQAEKTKSAILSITKELLKEKNFDEISVQEICQLSNTSIGSFYHHFGSKEGLIIERYKECDEYFHEIVLPKLINEEPTYAITEYLAEQCDYALKLGAKVMQKVYQAQINNGANFFISNDRGLPDGLRQIVNKAKSKGSIDKDSDTEEILNELLIISRGNIYNWCVYDGKYDLIASVRKMTENYLKAYIVK